MRMRITTAIYGDDYHDDHDGPQDDDDDGDGITDREVEWSASSL